MAAAVDLHAPRKVAMSRPTPQSPRSPAGRSGSRDRSSRTRTGNYRGAAMRQRIQPDGGPLQADSWSDARHESGYAAEDLITRVRQLARSPRAGRAVTADRRDRRRGN